MSDFDPNRLRWGDSFPIPIAPGVPNTQTFQIVNARASGLPETWKVFLFMSVLEGIGASGMFANFKVTLGVGAGTVTFPFALVLDAGTVPPVITPWSIRGIGTQSFTEDTSTLYTFLEIPAKDIQISCTINGNNVGASPLNLTIGAWVAPLVPAAQAVPGEEPPRHEHQWMGPGFHPEALRYK